MSEMNNKISEFILKLAHDFELDNVSEYGIPIISHRMGEYKKLFKKFIESEVIPELVIKNLDDCIEDISKEIYIDFLDGNRRIMKECILKYLFDNIQILK